MHALIGASRRRSASSPEPSERTPTTAGCRATPSKPTQQSQRTSLIVTTNLPFESWPEVLGSERLTGATLDRLTHRCRIIETKGDSYRLHAAKTRTRRAAQATPVATAAPDR